MDATSASPGETIVITGDGWRDDCSDTSSGPRGACAAEPEPDHPLSDIVIEIRRIGDPNTLLRLAEDVAADGEFQFRVEVIVPNLEPGEYVLMAHTGSVSGFPRPKLQIETE
ncbi:MAG: hypothetical protein ACT4PO_00775 [Actinomycetota bacterium]